MKIRIRRRAILSAEEIFFFFALFFVSSFAFLENVSIPFPLFSNLKMPLLYAGAVCILMHFVPLFRVRRKRKYFFVILALTLFLVLLEVSAVINRNPFIGSNPKRATIRLILYLAELFLLMIWTSETGRSKYVLNFLFYYVFLLTAATDIIIVFLGKTALGVSAAGIYLVGTKFSVAYFHINLFVLWFMRNRERVYSEKKAKRIIYIGFPAILTLSLYVDCMTGVVGCLALLVLFIMLNTSVRQKVLKLTSPVLLLLAILGCAIFPFVASGITAITGIENLLEDVMRRSTTLTGRIHIYQEFADAMQGHWLWGYGFGNAYSISMAKYGYANAQNAIFQWILQVGIISVSMLVVLLLTIVSRLNCSNMLEKSIPLVLLMYLYIFLGTVETTFSMSFLLWIALIFMYSCGSKLENSEGIRKQ